MTPTLVLENEMTGREVEHDITTRTADKIGYGLAVAGTGTVVGEPG